MENDLIKSEIAKEPITCGHCGSQSDYTGDHYFEDDYIFYKTKCSACKKESIEAYTITFEEILIRPIDVILKK